ncbi:MAG: ribonuclease P protein component [Geobacteraceae bacterium]|nr:ribonuclease P protein component [Geobacteraceae bacterium]
MGASLCRDEKLLKRADYLRLSASGKKYHTHHFLIIWSANDYGRARLGITASRKLGPAVARNWVKRRVRECFRLSKEKFISADFNIIAKKGADTLTFHEVRQELEKAALCIRNLKCSNGCS